MKRFIAILTLALTAALSADEAFAADVTQDDYIITNGRSYFSAAEADDIRLDAWYSPDTVDGIIAIIALAATETGIIGPEDRPNIMAPLDCPELVDLWFELVDAGYTDDEAFEMIEMAIGENGRSGWDQPVTQIIHDRSTKQDTIN
ncbi:MAG: hypothetical protein MK102_12660 [Fuerstiella sp.]|nr:hypothetical protein [Fuerstiella sp.]